MTALSIVKRFDVIEYTQARLFSSFIIFMMHKFVLQCTEEALSYSVIPAIALATHAAFTAVSFKLFSKCVTGVLTTAVRVHQFGRLPLLAKDSHSESIHDQIGSHTGGHRPTNYLARK